MKKRSEMILSSVLITVATLILPFRATAGNEIRLGYPLRFLTIYKSAFASVRNGWHPTVLQLISVDLLTFCLDAAVIYFVLTAFQKARKKHFG